MTAKELIEALSKFPPDSYIIIRKCTDEGRYRTWDEFEVEKDEYERGSDVYLTIID